MTEIAIVGGGFAGAVLALWCQREGASDVRIHEARSGPGTTPCGEGLSQASLNLLEPVFDASDFVDTRFQGARWRFPGTEITLRQPCQTMARERWIPAMLEAFEGRGGTVEYGRRLDRAGIMGLDADVVVGCDGPGSRVRAFVPGAAAELVSGFQVRLDAQETTPWLEFVTDKRFSAEYAWWFPRSGGHNVGLLGRGDGQDWQRLDAFVESLGLHGRTMARQTYPIAFGAGNVASPDGRYALLGDAAGLTNPLTKGGMAAVLHAAPILARSLRRGNAKAYRQALEAHPLRDQSFAKALRLLRQWNNERFATCGRALGGKLEIGGAGRPRIWQAAARLAVRHPGAIRHAPGLVRAGRLSAAYSW